MDHNRKKVDGQLGVTLIESLVAISIAGIASLGLMNSFVTSLRVAKLTEVNYAASTLAASKMEELAAIDVSVLSAANNATETLTEDGLNVSFTRTAAITVNADQSRTISVQVTSNSTMLPANVSVSTTLSAWE